VEFTWNVDPVLIAIGPLKLRYYGLLFLGVFLGGFRLYRWQVLRGGGTEEEAGGIVVPGVVAVLVGARLGHVFFYEFDKAMADPLWIIQFWKGGLASHGATLGLIVMLAWWARRYKQSYVEVLDRFAWSAALSTILVRVGNFFNSEIVGRATDQSWGVRFPRHDSGLPLDQVPLRHPSQLYEVALGLLVMGALFAVDKYFKGEKRPRGVVISTFFVVYFTGRFLVEFFKEFQGWQEANPGAHTLTMGQYLSMPLVALGIFGLLRALTRPTPAHWNAVPAK
jgi:prolipoprotein diacylglyceryl transferase